MLLFLCLQLSLTRIDDGQADFPLVLGFTPVRYMYLALLLTLQVLHVFWFSTIVKMVVFVFYPSLCFYLVIACAAQAIAFLKAGNVETDLRSDDEDDDSDVEPSKSR